MNKLEFIVAAYRSLGVYDVSRQSLETTIYMIDEPSYAITIDERGTGKTTSACVALAYIMYSSSDVSIGIKAGKYVMSKCIMSFIAQVLEGAGTEFQYKQTSNHMKVGSNTLEIIPNGFITGKFDVIYIDEPASMTDKELTNVSRSPSTDTKYILAQYSGYEMRVE